MTIARHIEIAMMHHKAGNTDATIRILEGMLRSSMSKKQTTMVLNALYTIKR